MVKVMIYIQTNVIYTMYTCRGDIYIFFLEQKWPQKAHPTVNLSRLNGYNKNYLLLYKTKAIPAYNYVKA